MLTKAKQSHEQADRYPLSLDRNRRHWFWVWFHSSAIYFPKGHMADLVSHWLPARVAWAKRGMAPSFFEGGLPKLTSKPDLLLDLPLVLRKDPPDEFDLFGDESKSLMTTPPPKKETYILRRVNGGKRKGNVWGSETPPISSLYLSTCAHRFHTGSV